MQKRIFSIDFTRGIAMMIMALDHTRDLLHVTSATSSPTDLSTTTPLLFFTRWLTYLCAPIFVFLAGSSVYIARERKGDIAASRKFLFRRGAFLVGLEFTIVSFGMFMDAGFHLLLFEVIAAIGTGLIILSFLLPLKPQTIIVIALVILLLHDAVIYIPMKEGSMIMNVLSPLFSPMAFPFAGRVFVMGYPPVPWLGIILLGFGAGPLFMIRPAMPRARFGQLAIGCLVLFVIFRLLNVYGDPAPWAAGKNALFTFLSFMNVTKYPPSLAFTLVTVGCMFIILWIGEQAGGKWAEVPDTYGKAPLFYFIVHFYFIHLILLAVLFLQGYHWSDLDFAGGGFGRPKGRPNGLPLWAVYLVWPCVVGLLYKPCRWFNRYRAARAGSWLKYV